jgi:predicted CXXCH cytochrome family protein
LSQTHAIEGLARNTYHPDGQIRDVEEPYNYTPFKQGKMFAAGVTCSDCHEPHSAKLRASGEGVCLQCHASDKYADVKHRHHAGIGPAPTCISRHMQARTFMVIDPRHDHAFRVPRPDLSVKLGTPNACNDCHRDKPAQWAADHRRTMVRPSPTRLSDLWTRNPCCPIGSGGCRGPSRRDRRGPSCAGGGARQRAFGARFVGLAREHRRSAGRFAGS